MTGKLCSKCHIGEVPDNIPGSVCEYCSAEVSPHYDVQNMRDILGLSSDEQVRRKARKGEIPGRVPGIRRCLWRREDIDAWLKQSQPIPRIPTSPLQEEALALCKKKDHSWLWDDKYEGIAYARKDASTYDSHVIKIGWNHTCYFCKFSQYIPFG